jgi:SAM-dependent methyltransferase
VSGEPLHPSTRGFRVAAEAYDRGRPEYPSEAVSWLAERLRIGPGRRVLDLAAGTGKLTRRLAVTGAEVVAVEPLAEMLERLVAALPAVEAHEGTAEAIPLPDADVDAVTVAQAFHWFRSDAALPELHRVLRPGGGLGLVWNTRDQDDPLQAEITQLIRPLAGGTPEWLALRGALAATIVGELFGPVEEQAFTMRQELDADGLVQRVLSISYVAAASERDRRRIERRLRDLAGGGAVSLPYTTLCFVSYRRGGG